MHSVSFGMSRVQGVGPRGSGLICEGHRVLGVWQACLYPILRTSSFVVGGRCRVYVEYMGGVLVPDSVQLVPHILHIVARGEWHALEHLKRWSREDAVNQVTGLGGVVASSEV
jgi:hypothetical protein